MIYSCFDERTGRYDYFEDSRDHAVNGDFPVPKLAGLQAGKVGVPARDAGRPLPSGAKKTSSGWSARGLIVNCKRSGGISGFEIGPVPPIYYLFWVAAGSSIGALGAYVGKGDAKRGALAGAGAGAAVVLLADMFLRKGGA